MKTRTWQSVILLLLLLLLCLGCGAGPGKAPVSQNDNPSGAAQLSDQAVADTGFVLRSAAFGEMQAIPARYTCEGLDLSPPLEWTAPPAGTKCLALLVSDPDAPDPAAPQMIWTHWVLLNLPPVAGQLSEQAGNAQQAQAGALPALNSWARTGWGGPCPPVGRHRYQFRLLALDTLLADRPDWTREQVEAFAPGHELARASLTATYQKHQP